MYYGIDSFLVSKEIHQFINQKDCSNVPNRADGRHRLCHFDSAQIAFEALNGDNVPFGHLARKKLTHLGIALSTLDPHGRPGGVFKPHNASVSYLMVELLRNEYSVAKLSSDLWKCVKIKESDDVCFYSDSDYIDVHKAAQLHTLCHNVGLDVRIFRMGLPE